MRAKKKTPHIDWQQNVTDQIVKQLEQGTAPWSRPWAINGYNGLAKRHTGEYYRGVNLLVLDMATMAKGWHSGYWMTFRQAKLYGAQVKKGEKSTRIFKAGTFNKTVEKTNTKTGQKEDVDQAIPYLKAYPVFNADQIDDLPARFYQKPAINAPGHSDDRRSDVECFFRRQLSDVRHGGNRAFYRPGSDYIQMPPWEAFNSASAYYSTLAHEHTHWTKGGERVKRDCGSTGFGSPGYAKEELVAELGASYLCRFFQFENHAREDHAAYIGSWLKVLKGNKREIFRAAAHAQRAIDWMIDRAGMNMEPAIHEPARHEVATQAKAA